MREHTLYDQRIYQRSTTRYIIGLFVRWKQNLKYERARRLARKNGAKIGDAVIIPLSLAKKANSNLTIGSHTSVQTDLIDLRNPVKIGSHVIIGKNTEIITTSHNIDSPEWEHKGYGITIEDYAWIPVKVLVLPSCRKIGYGAVISSGSVVVKDVPTLSVISGNPAQEIRKRKCVHSELVVESLLGGDYSAYKEARKSRK